MGKADLHIHTLVSDGFATVGDTLDHIEHHTDLDVVAITDHEDIGGGLRARDLAAKRQYRFEVVVGAEITTLQGHLLGLYIESAPKSFRTIDRTIAEIHDQGGLAVVPHPMSWLTRSVGQHAIDRLAGGEGEGVTIDAIERENPSIVGQVRARRCAQLNADWGLPETGGSDAHHLAHLGSAWTEFPGESAEDLYRAITLGMTRAESRGYPPLREIGWGKLALGIAWGFAATPRKMARGITEIAGRRRQR